MRRRSNKSRSEPVRVLDHIQELKTRLFVCAVALIIAGVAVYFYYEPILDILRSPLGSTLYYSTPAGSFAFIMKICFMGALIVTVPLIIYNLIMFVRPAFEKRMSLRGIYLVTLGSASLAIAGALFGFYIILPGSLHFFSGFQVDGLNAIISADSYLNYVTNIIITFVLAFQLPIVLGFIDRIKPLTPGGMLRMEKWIILGSLLVSLLVPFAFDFSTSILISLPIIVLYNISVMWVILRHAAHKSQSKRQFARTEFDLTVTDDLIAEFTRSEQETAPVTPAVPVSPTKPVATQAFDIVRPAAIQRRLIIPTRPVPPRITVVRSSRLISDIRPVSGSTGPSPAST